MNSKTIFVRLAIIYAAELAVWELCHWLGYGLGSYAAEIMVVVPASLTLVELAGLFLRKDQQRHEELVRRLDAEEGR